ncbi:MAG: hypothetical protein ACR2P1_27945 [Pseudomonadales bacterium]
MRGNILLSSVLLSLLLVCGCGNGSGSDRINDVAEIPSEVVDPPSPGEVVVPPGDTGSAEIGLLLDSAVYGVTYETPTHHGVTGLDGSFQYEEGETVQFMIGDTLLGEVIGQEQITPFDLAGSAIITGTPSITEALENKYDPFHTVINIATLLQSLDHDADPENGIEIRPAVAALFEGASLDLRQEWETFRNEPTLRHVLGQANTQILFIEAHGLVNPAPALQHLYEALGIDARTHAKNLEQRDDDGDGTLDSVESWQYDADGNVTRSEWDEEVDGILDRVSSFQYEAHGNQMREETMSARDGLHEVLSWQYDPSGRPTRIEWDEDGDGTPDYIESRDYDANGNQTRWVLDDDGDGTPEFTASSQYQYDGSGNVTREDADDDGDGTTDRTTSYQYDAHDNLTRLEEKFEPDDGTSHIEEWHYEYDASGNMTRKERYPGLPNGSPFSLESWQYDADGKVTRFEHEGFGSITIVTSQYDADDNLTREERQRLSYDVVGVLIRTNTAVDTENEAGWETRWEWDDDADGTPDKITIFQEDVHGNLISEEEDFDGDGTPDEISITQYDYQHDADGNLTHEARDEGGDGTVDEIVSYEYEATGWGHIFDSTAPLDPRVF